MLPREIVAVFCCSCVHVYAVVCETARESHSGSEFTLECGRSSAEMAEPSWFVLLSSTMSIVYVHCVDLSLFCLKKKAYISPSLPSLNTAYTIGLLSMRPI